MPIIRRLSDDPYQWDVAHAELSDVANVEASVPRDYITEDGFGITDACRRYLQPLIAGEDYPPYRNGLPDYARLRLERVPRKLGPFNP
jgi:6-phosphofructokinase 1